MRQLEWRDVDLSGRVVRLRPEISKNKDGRVWPFQGELLEVIERAKQKRVLSSLYVSDESEPPIGNFRKAWQTAAVAAGLCKCEKINGKKKYTGIIVHDLRRTGVRNMIRAGVPERVAMSLSGHKTPGVFDRYNIVSESDLRDAMTKTTAYVDSLRAAASVASIRTA